MVNRMRGRLALIALFLVAAASITASQAAATTEPTAAFFEHISLTDHKIVLDHSRVDVGTLVIFIVKNNGRHARKITVGSYKSGYLQPGTSLRFELSFPVPWSFKIVSVGHGVPRLFAPFVCTF
jgi:hypothetical protein